MAPKKKSGASSHGTMQGYIEDAGVVKQEPITDTLRSNYMPYAMSVIVSRAIPEIDGFKPSHRKILYTMYLMKLLSGPRTKSANVVGQVMQLNPHGDQAIYETMVRMSTGNETLLHAYIDSKGNFGKSYSRDMDYAASRYTEVRLAPIASELFQNIDKDTVDFVDNYDNKMKEPTLLPTTFPSVLVNSNMGIAVGMASSISSFNLEEVCETTIAILKNPEHDLHETLKGPDFSGGGYILYNQKEMSKIFDTGRGGVRVRSKYRYDKSNHCIEVTEIPPTTTVEGIIDKIIDLVKSGKIREISDIRDETDLSGLKLTMDLKRGVDPDKLMQKLFRMTPLEDSFSCNFNILIDGHPRIMGVREILDEWISFRLKCINRQLNFEKKQKADRLHLLEGLSKILLDIDKVVRIVRETEEEKLVVPHLMEGFGIDEIQANYVAEIRLRNLNKEYILKRLDEIKGLTEEIEEINLTLGSERRQKAVIIKDLKNVIKKYAQPRKSLLYFGAEEEKAIEVEDEPDYPVVYIYTKECYLKKITPQSLRMSGEQKLKEGDEIVNQIEATNQTELLFFTNKCQCYKTRGAEFEDGKASLMGDYVPAKLGMDEGEEPIGLIATNDYTGDVLTFFENGKVSRVPLSSYETKTRRKKLLKATSAQAPVKLLTKIVEDQSFLIKSTDTRMVLFDSSLVPVKATKDNSGVIVISLKKNQKVSDAMLYTEDMLKDPKRYVTRKLPSPGALSREEVEQASLF